MKTCPDCHSTLKPVPKTHFLYRCKNCQSQFYISVCWCCHNAIFKRDTALNHCDACNWYFCDSCGSCSENCTTRTAFSPQEPLTSAEVEQEFALAQDFATDPYADGDPEYNEDGFCLEDEIPDGFWEEWSEEDRSAYAR